MAMENELTDPTYRGRQCTTCQVWLPCCVIESVEARAAADGVSRSDVVLAALREYLGETVE